MNVELQQLSKRYGAVHALDRVSLNLGPGQIVAVIGLNGAGKTTLLRCLAGIVAPTSGMVRYDAQPFLRRDLSLRRRLLFLPDFPPMFGHMTALQHIALLLRLYERETDNLDDRIIGNLREFDLLPLAEARLGTLSRGQLYKVALTALLAVAPELWLLDEPFASGLD
ncbi:MAG TPA: ABC transporter ATP-binding protein, partial [Opitutaceae bacterium]|nr:ABC transporter ATP-binding protein [Opitutaceae bacterium]